MSIDLSNSLPPSEARLPGMGLGDLISGAVGVRVSRTVRRLKGRADASYVLPYLAVGGRPRSQAVARERFDAVLDLTEGANPAGDFEYLNVPVENGRAPLTDQTVLMLDWIHERLGNGKKVLIHCSLGRGRAPYVAASYLMKRDGSDAAEAFKAVKSKRRFAHLNQEQALSLTRFEAYLRGATAST